MVSLPTNFLVYAVLGLIILALFIGFYLFGDELVGVIIEWFKGLTANA